MSVHDLSGDDARRLPIDYEGLPIEPVQVTSGPTLCDLRVWTEEEWAALSPAQRPADHKHVPGLGWVGAVPRLFLN